MQCLQHDCEILHVHSQGRIAQGLELLTALAEEGDALERRRRNILLLLLIRRSPDVLQLLGSVLSAQMPGDTSSILAEPWLQLWNSTMAIIRTPSEGRSSVFAGQASPQVAALKCAKVWLHLDLDGGGSSFISSGQLRRSQVRCYPPAQFNKSKPHQQREACAAKD